MNAVRSLHLGYKFNRGKHIILIQARRVRDGYYLLVSHYSPSSYEIRKNQTQTQTIQAFSIKVRAGSNICPHVPTGTGVLACLI